MSLREEIRQLQAESADLKKWKFLVTGSVAAAALGFVEHAPNGSAHALALLPFLALYADLLCVDHDMKIFVTAAYLKTTTTDANKELRDYELFYDALRKRGIWWWFAGWAASFGSSIAIAVAVLLYGTYVAKAHRHWFWVSGGLGGAAQIALWVWYQVMLRRMHPHAEASLESDTRPPAAEPSSSPS